MLQHCYKIDTDLLWGAAILELRKEGNLMPNIKMQLKALAIEFHYTRSNRALNEIKNLARRLNPHGTVRVREGFYRACQF